VEHKSLFDDFLKDVVNIDQGRLDSLDTSIAAIQNYLLESDYGTRIRFLRQGSLAHSTIIRPLSGQEFDADIVLVVNENTDWESKNYLLDLRWVMWDSSTYKDKAHLSDVCVTLNYARDKKKPSSAIDLERSLTKMMSQEQQERFDVVVLDVEPPKKP